MRFELTTSTLARLRSTPELRPQTAFQKARRIIPSHWRNASPLLHFFTNDVIYLPDHAPGLIAEPPLGVQLLRNSHDQTPA